MKCFFYQEGGGDKLINKIYYDETTKEEDLKKFIEKPKVKEVLNKLEQSDAVYIIAVDVASNKTKDFSCISYFRKNSDGNLIFINSIKS